MQEFWNTPEPLKGWGHLSCPDKFYNFFVKKKVRRRHLIQDA